MAALIENLQSKMNSLDSFADLTARVLEYLPNVTTRSFEKNGYTISVSESAGATKYSRPVRQSLFIRNRREFEESFQALKELMDLSTAGTRSFNREDHLVVDSCIYTMQQSVGVGLDFLSNPNGARKHTGNRFEELTRLLVTAAGVKNKRVVLKIPYAKDALYSAETDLVFSPFDSVRSHSTHIEDREVVVSLKTSSKDRMGKIFVDKMLMEKFVEHPVKLIGIFLNDVQRKDTTGISYTFVSGLFMVYTEFLVELDGVYFVDPPPVATKPPYSNHIFRFSNFLLEDIHKLIT